MKFSRRPLLFATAGIVLLGVLGYAFRPRPAPVEVVRVASGPLASYSKSVTK